MIANQPLGFFTRDGFNHRFNDKDVPVCYHEANETEKRRKQYESERSIPVPEPDSGADE